MKRKKIGIILITSIIAVAGISVGLTFWNASITFFGTISTGSVSCEVIEFIGTWVYEDNITGECIVSDKVLDNESLKLIAYSKTISGDDYDVLIIFDNLFPSVLFKSGITLKYTGTIPGKISNISLIYNSSDSWIEDLILSGDIYTTIHDSAGNNVSLGYLIHKDEKIEINFYINIPHNQNLKNLSGYFSSNFEILQWNEYIPPPGNNSPPSGTLLNISNFTIYQTSSDQNFILPENTIINPKEYIIIARDSNQADFESFWGVSLEPNICFINSENTFPSINGDETFELRDENNTIVDGPTGQPMVTYHTIERINTTADPTNPNSWNISADIYATPGQGAVGDGSAGLIINEYSDASGTGNWRFEFIELYYDVDL